jgi:hypothetical protein
VQGDEPRRIFEALIAQLAARRDDPLDRLEYLLRNCGYLAERRADRVVLSDNAHPGDFQYLAPWLPFGPDALATFPWVRELSRRATESCGIGRRQDRFLQRAHGSKVAVRCLDGLVAYLVKALSAVGVITHWSCAGHVGFLGVGLDRGCSSAWTALLIREVETRVRLFSRWEVKDEMLIVHPGWERIAHPGEGVDWVRYFLEVLDVADLLYQDRVRWRATRRKLAEQLDEGVERCAYPSILLNMDLLLTGPLLR